MTTLSFTRTVLRSLAVLCILMSPARAGGAGTDSELGLLAHAEILKAHPYPSATECGVCHPRHYREWSVSQHAYAMLSPLHNSLQATVTKLTNGTNGDFCIRCHTAPGMEISESLFTHPENRIPASQEGVTCISCHRVDQEFGKFSGRMAIVAGDIHTPISGPAGNYELERALAAKRYRLTTEAGNKPGRAVHADVQKLGQMSEPGFCGRCHDVTLSDGFRLEEAFSEYKNSHAAQEGVSCQDCHMGKVQSDPSAGYEHGPAAVVGGVPTKDRRLTNHMIVGPDESIIHPGIFPHNPAAKNLASIDDWVAFDVDAGWGTDEFEDKVTEDMQFPERWSSVDDRHDAREIIEDQLSLLQEARDRGWDLLRKGFLLGDIEVRQASEKGIRFRVPVRSGIDSHNVPTGFSAERLIFLSVRLEDANGKLVFVSGDLDAQGNLRDLHSELVHSGDIPQDKQLFNLQSRFLLRNLRGGEREQVLPVNFSQDALPFIRPNTSSSVLKARTNTSRQHRKGIEPGGVRWGKYRIKGKDLTGAGPYRLKVELIVGMVPANLVQAMSMAGFLYDMSEEEVIDEIIERHRILDTREIEIPVGVGS